METAYLGLGSNVGDRLALLRAARAELGRRGVRVVRSSPVYETEAAEGARGQPDFLNACVEALTELEPEELLDACKAAERALGRPPGGARHAPRPVDVDVLLLGDRVHSSERMTLPHPAIRERRFVLVPLLDLDPMLRLPDGAALSRALAAVGDQRVEPFGEL